jgi:sarcosine oxidase subunit gamma
MSTRTLGYRSGFAGLDFESGPAQGVLATDRPAVSLATVLSRRGRLVELRDRARSEFALELPEGPRRVAAGPLAFVGTGPGAWLVTAEGGDAEFAAALARTLESCAAVTDQSGAHALLRLSGAQIRSTLAKMLPLDLHPRVFAIGAAAATAAAQVPVLVWRLEDSPAGLAVFEIAVARSLCVSFWHSLTQSAAEFGFVFSPG